MKRYIKKFHNENNGSTLVIVLTVVAFLAILAVIVTSTAAVNYKMKLVNKQSQKVFYTSENAVNEIYAALGEISMTSFDAAYNEELENVVKHTSVGGYDKTYTVSGVTANKNMRESFAYNLITALKLWNGAVPEKNAVGNYDIINYNSVSDSENKKRKEFVDLLNTFLEEEEGLEVVSVESIAVITGESKVENAGLKTYTLTFKDCVIRYINEQQYYSTIAFDCNMTMPDIYIEFATDSKSGLDTFKDYALIGNTGVIAQENSRINLVGSIYAGKLKGLSLCEASVLNVSGSSVNMIVGGDITVENSSLTAHNKSIWCTGIILNGNEGAKLDINSNAYVKDDLQLDGDNSSATVAGNYYGYSYVGLNPKEGNHNNSSAIILNGENAVLNMTSINELLLSGSAYIDYKNGATAYPTGEGLALKGTQEIYLVPSYLMNKANPVVGDTSDVTVNINAGNFFGYKYLDIPAPYTTREIDGVTYYYLNFDDENSAAAYVRALLDDDVYAEEVVASLNNAENNKDTIYAYDKSREYVQKVIKTNLTSLSSIVNITSGSTSVKASSSLIKTNEINGSINPSVADKNDGADVNFTGLAQEYSKRYSSWTTILSEPDSNIKISDYAENNVFTNIVSIEKLNELVKNGAYAKEVPGLNKVILYACDNNKALEIGTTGIFEDYDNGIIVATGDVIVKKSFNGTIISGGNIIIEGTDITIGNAIAGTSVGEILDMGRGENRIEEIGKFTDIFGGGITIKDDGSIKLSELTYKDFAEFVNWRKSYEKN